MSVVKDIFMSQAFGGGGGGGGSSYKLLATKEYEVSTTSTSAIDVDSFMLDAEEVYTADKLVYVRVRPKEEPESGFYGVDQFIPNPYPAQPGGYSANSNAIMYVKGNGVVDITYSNAGTKYGVYVQNIASDGTVSVKARYNSSSSKTIDGTYVLELYLLDWPDNVSPFA